MLVYKIVHHGDWAKAQRAGSYAGSAKDVDDGFLHFSTASQLAETLRRYYRDADGLLLVAVDAAALGAALRHEHAPSRGEDFPHLYASLDVALVQWVRPIARDSAGGHRLPPLA